MKDYRVKEEVTKGGSRFIVQKFYPVLGYLDMSSRRPGVVYCFSSLFDAKKKIRSMRNGQVLEEKYHEA